MAVLTSVYSVSGCPILCVCLLRPDSMQQVGAHLICQLHGKGDILLPFSPWYCMASSPGMPCLCRQDQAPCRRTDRYQKLEELPLPFCTMFQVLQYSKRQWSNQQPYPAQFCCRTQIFWCLTYIFCNIKEYDLILLFVIKNNRGIII